MFDYLFAATVGVFAAKVRHRNGWIWGGLTLLFIGVGQAYIYAVGGDSLPWTVGVIFAQVLLLVALKPGQRSTPCAAPPQHEQAQSNTD